MSGAATIPTGTDKALKYYPAEDVAQPKIARKTQRPTKYRQSLQPGRVLILLSGRFRGKRVILLKQLEQGVLLVTGPFKLNGVPLRRVNSRYVIATSTSVPIEGLDESTIKKASETSYFARDNKKDKKGSEEAFFKQTEGAKPEKKEISKDRAEDQKKIDKPLLASIKKEAFLGSYLSSSFSLRKGDRPHEMVF
ncbi:hypothetical protein K431DRAFT_254764 [Polychaeton citri CBS 116435]|uniref:60S ribosomal protein L6 n=1 Tax=Polychaeton citri CBS 116435 TaxID=1314669 RepID=A0A9P4Q1G1_9PEZI|nr:hypothetical protein K431DRAFT_254764 [Polychaeton citri CBS 116435]